MKDFEKMKSLFYQYIEETCYGEYKQKAYTHSLSTCTLCQYLASKKDLDLEVASIIGLMHDIGQYMYHQSFQHAQRSKEFVAIHLRDDYVFKDVVLQAIENHSDKEHKHDDYSELLKEADLLAQYFEEPDQIFSYLQKEKINKALE